MNASRSDASRLNASRFCNGFQWIGADDAGRLVTPWRYDDGDQVVVFARREGSEWRVDDNGEGLFRLAAAGVDPESPAVLARLGAFPTLLGVRVEEDGETLCTRSAELESAALAVAEASSQVMALACLRRERSRSDFREQVVKAVWAAAAAAGVEARCDKTVEFTGAKALGDLVAHRLRH